MKKLYIGYYRLDDQMKFELSETPVWEDDVLGYNTNTYLFVSPNVSVQYLRKVHIDRPLELNAGEVMYSFDKEKVSEWLLNKYNNALYEITEKYRKITNTHIEDYSSPLNLTGMKCPHCYSFLHESDVEGYPYVCLKCDENFYKNEVK